MQYKGLLIVFLMLASASFGWTQTTQGISTANYDAITPSERATMKQVSINRMKNGLEPLHISKALSVMADIYNYIQMTKSDMTHHHLPIKQKTDMLQYYAKRTGEYHMFYWNGAWAELLSNTRNEDYFHPKIQSHVYDYSREHSTYLYSNKYDYIGWSEIRKDGRLWVTTYLIDAKDKYDK